MNKLFLVIGTAFIFVVTGMAVASVGQLPTSCGEPYGATLPFVIFLVMAGPSAFFYLAGLGQSLD